MPSGGSATPLSLPQRTRRNTRADDRRNRFCDPFISFVVELSNYDSNFDQCQAGLGGPAHLYGVHANVAGGFDVERAVVEKEDRSGAATQGIQHVLERLAVRLDLTGEMGSEVVVKCVFEIELGHQPPPVQFTVVA